MLRDNQRVQDALSSQGFRALVATTAENVRYLTDYDTPALFIYRYPGAYAIALPNRDLVLDGGRWMGDGHESMPFFAWVTLLPT